jgi:predicted ATPase
LRQAEFSLGDLTIICGANNTGKTYATYALYGFLESWRNVVMKTVVLQFCGISV